MLTIVPQAVVVAMMAVVAVAIPLVAVQNAVIVIRNEENRHVTRVVNRLSLNQEPGVFRDTKLDEKSRAEHEDHRGRSLGHPENLARPGNLAPRHLDVIQRLRHVTADQPMRSEAQNDLVATVIVPTYIGQNPLTAVVLDRLMAAPSLVTAFLPTTDDPRASDANHMAIGANHRVNDGNRRVSGNLVEILNAEWTLAEVRIHDRPETQGQVETPAVRVMRGRAIRWMLLAAAVVAVR